MRVTEIARKRIEAWLDSRSHAKVRVISAPAGSGKTVMAKQYASRRKNGAVYARVPTGAGRAALRELLAAGRGGGTVILDDVDRMEPSAYAGFVEELCDDNFDTRLVLVGRSRRRLLVHALLARGVADVYESNGLAFDVSEIVELASKLGVEHDDNAVAQTIYDTEGWPLVVAWMLREAAERRIPLRDAYASWCERNGHVLLEFIANEHRRDPEALDVFRSLLEGGPNEERTRPEWLERLEQDGFPLIRTRDGARPYRIVRRLVAASGGRPTDRISQALPPIMLLSVLGQFRCEIGGHPVTFSRRRDQNVFAYVAIAAGGRATREAVLEAFWPRIDHRLAAQGLRTTISRIRRAIAEAAQGFNPDLYFHTESELRVDWATVVVDARRFNDLVEQGRLDDVLGAVENAKCHYRLAYGIYRGRLLASEALEPAFVAPGRHFDALYVQALGRLTQLHAATGELDVAREYAREYLAHSGEGPSTLKLLVSG
jgi:hypothetical protein